MRRILAGKRPIASPPLALVLAAGAGCAPQNPTPEPDTGNGGGTAADTGDSGEPEARDACTALRPGAAGLDGFAADLAVAHGAYRLFSPAGDWLGADDALADMLVADDPWTRDSLHTYAAALGDVCVLDADPAALGAARVTQEGTLAVIVPGTGSVTLPAGVTGVVIDLRDVPSTPETEAAVRAAAGLALAAPVDAGQRKLRVYSGFPMQWSAGVYGVSRTKVDDEIAATGAEELPLAFLLGPRVAPDAAVVAGALRMAGRASIQGYDLYAADAEMSWRGVGDEGLAWRAVLRLGPEGSPWPDVIGADNPTTEADPALVAPAAVGSLESPSGAADRAVIDTIDLQDGTTPRS